MLVRPPLARFTIALILVSAAATAAPAQSSKSASPAAHPDPALEATTPRQVKGNRPEQALTPHDEADIYGGPKAMHESPAFLDQPDDGEARGFDFARDPLNAKEPMQSADEITKADMAARAGVTANQRKLLESRYDLEAKTDPSVKMSRGKPIVIGPTAKPKEPFEKLAEMSAEEIKKANAFPYPSLPHPKQATGGQVFPRMQIDLFPRLERFDVDFDIPDAFLPEFPPAMFLQNRPELGDVSRGQVVSLENFWTLFKDILTPVQLDGLRFLLIPLPQEEFNLTDDRKTPHPQLGVACFDCHVNGHTTGQFHLSPDIRPEHRRFRLDTTSLRGMFIQQIHSSKRSLRSVEDFTEFEQRTAYFNGDPIRPMKKGQIILDRVHVSHMAQFQNMLDFPPAPKLDLLGHLDGTKATENEMRGEQVFYGKGKCAGCHPPPYFLDNSMHDLHLERFLDEPPDGPIKTFTLRGIKESPPYMHDGRAFTLEDTVELFNLALGTKLSPQEKSDLVAFLRVL